MTNTKGIVRKAIYDKRNELIVKMYDERWNLSQIAVMFNLVHTTILRILEKAGKK